MSYLLPVIKLRFICSTFLVHFRLKKLTSIAINFNESSDSVKDTKLQKFAQDLFEKLST